MKELIGTGTNVFFTLDKETKKFEPQVEIILMMSEAEYVYKGDSIQKSRARIETFRFMASPAGMGILLKSLVEAMEEINKQAEDAATAAA